MVGPTLKSLSLQERGEAQALAVAAADEAARAIHSSTLAAAGAILAILGRADAAPAKASALRSLRTNYRLAQAVAYDVTRASHQARDRLASALEHGFRTDQLGRSAVVQAESTGLRLMVAVTADDLRQLSGYPIMGHTIDEIAAHLGQRLRYEIDGALGEILGGIADAKAVTGALGGVAQRHANRVSEAVRAAFYAGVQASTKALAAALTGAKQ